MSGGGWRASFLVKFEGDDDVVGLSGGEKVVSGRVDGETAGTLGFDLCDGWGGEGFVAVDGERCYGVMAPIAYVEKLTIWMN